MAGLVATALWLRRRDQRAHEQRLAQESAALAVAEDRLVIARELHDAVSGNLGAITVRCAVARRLETTPDGLRTALDDVETASREATDALRRMLAVLRDENMPPTPGALAAIPAGDAPAAGPGPVNSLTESLRELIGRACRTGVAVDLDAEAHIGADVGTAQATAWLDSNAGMMPSKRHNKSKASSAASSFAAWYSTRPMSAKWLCSGPMPG